MNRPSPAGSPEMAPVDAPLENSEHAMEARLDGVPPGIERRFEVFVYDSSNTLAFYGDESLDVGEAIVPGVSIGLARVGTVKVEGQFSSALD